MDTLYTYAIVLQNDTKYFGLTMKTIIQWIGGMRGKAREKEDRGKKREGSLVIANTISERDLQTGVGEREGV